MKNREYSLFLLSIIILSFLLGSCARFEIKERQQALRKLSQAPALSDDLSLEGFVKGLESEIFFLQKKRPDFLDFQFGEREISVEEYLSSLEKLLVVAKSAKDMEQCFSYIQEHFDFYEVYGREQWGEILLTSYYEPVFEASLSPSERFSMPIYRRPDDLVELDTEAFEKFMEGKIEGELPSPLYGRLSEQKSIRNLPLIQPYFSRREIDEEKKLAGKKLEIAYADPWDVFLLQIQGSGSLHIGRKIVRLGYAAQNGHKYFSIGKLFTDIIPPRQMSLEGLERVLFSLSEQERMDALYQNASYVFFKEIDGRPMTTLGTEVIDGRTLATDIRFFPKGALAFLSFSRPLLSPDGDKESMERASRFVFDQDTGGAIYGPGRADLFWGRGDEARINAGHVHGKANLYYLAPRL